MLKLKFSKPNMKTYMDGKITVCKYQCEIINNEDKSVIDSFTATGTAKCAPEDNLSPEVGRKLADSRAKMSAYKTASHLLTNEEIDFITEALKENIQMLDFVFFMRYLKQKENTHIKNICEEI